jgi:hypothetical protein
MQRNVCNWQIIREHEFVIDVNVVFMTQIRWPHGEDLSRVMASFKDWCGIPSI